MVDSGGRGSRVSKGVVVRGASTVEEDVTIGHRHRWKSRGREAVNSEEMDGKHGRGAIEGGELRARSRWGWMRYRRGVRLLVGSVWFVR